MRLKGAVMPGVFEYGNPITIGLRIGCMILHNEAGCRSIFEDDGAGRMVTIIMNAVLQPCRCLSGEQTPAVTTCLWAPGPYVSQKWGSQLRPPGVKEHPGCRAKEVALGNRYKQLLEKLGRGAWNSNRMFCTPSTICP